MSATPKAANQTTTEAASAETLEELIRALRRGQCDAIPRGAPSGDLQQWRVLEDALATVLRFAERERLAVTVRPAPRGAVRPRHAHHVVRRRAP